MDFPAFVPSSVFLSVFCMLIFFTSLIFRAGVRQGSDGKNKNARETNEILKKIESLNETIFPKSYKVYAAKTIEKAACEGRLNTKELLILQEICILGFLLLFFAFTGFRSYKLSFVMFSLILGFLLPLLCISKKAKKNSLSINESIPFFSDLLTLSCEAGLDIFAAMINFVENTESSPLKETIEAILKEVRLGKSRQDALREAYQKTDIWDLKTIYMTIIQSEALGTPIGKSLRNQVQTMRNNRMNRAERLAQEAPLKLMIPLLFFIFPVTFTVILSPIILRFIGGEMF